ncbi:MAG: A/G-specific adenine glycosylase [Pseudomonadota bacterium]|nr:A/G-specific adenine glycosylase [Pseudomonadota bacterium]
MCTPSRLLLDWYDRHRRVLPWRAEEGEIADPYAVWLSEIMLQQTTVAAVIPYYRTFLTRWPTVEALAAAPLEDILATWAGLGYYARARNLHACARRVLGDFGGRFPSTEAELRQLPGIGEYTAAAIASIAFGQRASAIDGNVKRVIARYCGIDLPPDKALPDIQVRAESLLPDSRYGDYTQALMELGATVCTPRSPDCAGCPWSGSCVSLAQGLVDKLPRRAEKKERPVRYTLAFWLTDRAGRVWLRRRPEKGLLGGMPEFPSTPWIAERQEVKALLAQAPCKACWQVLPGHVRHVFTHFPLEMSVAVGCLSAGQKVMEGMWVPVDALDRLGLPSLMAKIVRHVSANAVCDTEREMETVGECHG